MMFSVAVQIMARRDSQLICLAIVLLLIAFTTR